VFTGAVVENDSRPRVPSGYISAVPDRLFNLLAQLIDHHAQIFSLFSIFWGPKRTAEAFDESAACPGWQSSA